MQQLKVLQSLWAMERREPDGFERTLEENLQMVAAASFDGVSYFLEIETRHKRLKDWSMGRVWPSKPAVYRPAMMT